MKKYLILFLLLASPASAEQWIKCIDTTIGSVNFENPQRVEGDCLSLGLCSGANNSGLATNVFEAVGNEWNAAGEANKKCARESTPGFRVLDLSAQEIADIEAAQESENESALRVGAKEQFDGQHVTALALRCEAKAIIDEINDLRLWTRDFEAAVAAASTLAQMKTNVAALANRNDRTLAQAKTAIQSCIDNSEADEL